MHIYKLKADENHFLTFFIEAAELAKMDDDFDLSYDGKSKLDWWQTPNAVFYEGDDYSKKTISMPDITIWEGFIVLNGNAFKQLSPVLGSYGEFLPVLSEGIPYHLFNTLNRIDDSSIDQDNSEQALDNGIYMGLNKLNFHENKIDNSELLFRTSFDEYADVYCSGKFKKQVEAANLAGLVFETDLASY